MQSQFNTIKQHVQQIIKNEDDYYLLKQSINSLQQIFYSITGIKAHTSEADNDSYLEFGKAVSPIVAANCLHDIMRTKRFLQGVYRAIEELQTKFKGEKINILYAGSGPYATLVIPMCFLFNKDVFKCTILDIHEESIVSVKKIIREFKLEDYFTDVICGDAFTYETSKDKPHMIISEVLQMGLQNEPQVALTHHLAPQLKEGGVFIPQEIKLDLYHSKSEDNQNSDDSFLPKREETILGNILTLSTDSVACNLQENAYPNLNFAPLQVQIPEHRNENDTLEIQTLIEVYKGVFLTKNQSSLTIPITQTSLRGYSDDIVFEFKYQLSKFPKTICSIIKN